LFLAPPFSPSRQTFVTFPLCGLWTIFFQPTPTPPAPWRPPPDPGFACPPRTPPRPVVFSGLRIFPPVPPFFRVERVNVPYASFFSPPRVPSCSPFLSDPPPPKITPFFFVFSLLFLSVYEHPHGPISEEPFLCVPAPVFQGSARLFMPLMRGPPCSPPMVAPQLSFLAVFPNLLCTCPSTTLSFVNVPKAVSVLSSHFPPPYFSPLSVPSTDPPLGLSDRFGFAPFPPLPPTGVVECVKARGFVFLLTSVSPPPTPPPNTANPPLNRVAPDSIMPRRASSGRILVSHPPPPPLFDFRLGVCSRCCPPRFCAGIPRLFLPRYTWRGHETKPGTS